MEKTGKLYIVATPIGNLEDFTFRGIETLKKVDYILCEDTRVTAKLLAHFKIKKSLISYHKYSDEKKINEIKKLLENGKNFALVTDAGTPDISDPGNFLIASLTDVEVIRIPGVSAVTTALSVSGFSTDKFLFLGFPPHKKGRQTFFKEVAKVEYTLAFYESNHRIKKCLTELTNVLDLKRQVCVCRELTKKFEIIYRGNIKEILNMNILDKGEFVIVISKL